MCQAQYDSQVKIYNLDSSFNLQTIFQIAFRISYMYEIYVCMTVAVFLETGIQVQMIY